MHKVLTNHSPPQEGQLPSGKTDTVYALIALGGVSHLSQAKWLTVVFLSSLMLFDGLPTPLFLVLPWIVV